MKKNSKITYQLYDTGKRENETEREEKGEAKTKVEAGMGSEGMRREEKAKRLETKTGKKVGKGRKGKGRKGTCVIEKV